MLTLKPVKLQVPQFLSLTSKAGGKNTPLPGSYEAWMPIASVQGCIHGVSWERGILSFRPGSSILEM